MKFSILLIQFCIVLLVLSGSQACIVQAQTQSSLRGVVLDVQTRKVLRGVTVMLRNLKDSSIVQGARTSASGEYRLLLPKNGPDKEFVLQAQRIGYAKLSRRIHLDSMIHQVDTMALHESASVTDDIEVSAWRNYEQIAVDKRSYTVVDNPNITAVNVSDILDQIPSVQVDESGKVLLRGDSKVQIMVDGRPLTMDAEQTGKFLQQLSANSVEKIEVITNPGARYDTRFQGGIINLVSRKSLGDNLGALLDASASTIERRSLSAQLMYSDSTFTSSLGLGWNRWYEASQSNHYRSTPTDSASRSMSKQAGNTYTSNSFYLRPQLSVRLSASDQLVLNSTINGSKAEGPLSGSGQRMGSQNELLQRTGDTLRSDKASMWLDLAAVYTHQFTEKANLATTLGYTEYAPSQYDTSTVLLRELSGEIATDLSLIQRLGIREKHPQANLQIAYTTELSSRFEIEGGVRGSMTKNQNTYDVQTFDFSSKNFFSDSLASRNSNTFMDMATAYASSKVKIDSQWSTQLGLSCLYGLVGSTDITNRVERSYTYLFPNVSISYDLSADFHINAAYNNQVEFPDVDDLNPRVYRVSSTYTIAGNPNLKPQVTHFYQLDLNTNGGPWTLFCSPFYRRSTQMMRTSGRLEGAVVTNVIENFAAESTTGMDVQVAFRQRKGLSSRLNLSMFSYHNEGSSLAGDVATQATSATANCNVSYQFASPFLVATTFRYSAPTKTANGDVQAFYTSSLSLTAKFLAEALTVRFLVADIFNTERRGRTVLGEGYSLTSVSKPQSRYLMLTLSYTLGREGVSRQENPSQSGPGSGASPGG